MLHYRTKKSSQTVPMLQAYCLQNCARACVRMRACVCVCESECVCLCVCMCAHVKHLRDWCTGYENSRIRLSNPYFYHSTNFLFVNWKTSLLLLQSLHLLLNLTIKGHSSNLLGRFHHNPPPIRMVIYEQPWHIWCVWPACLPRIAAETWWPGAMCNSVWCV